MVVRTPLLQLAILSNFSPLDLRVAIVELDGVVSELDGVVSGFD